MVFNTFLFAASFILALSGCEKENTSSARLEIAPIVFEEFSSDGGSGSFTITASSSWTISSPEWIRTNPSKGNAADHAVRVNFTVAQNREGSRSGKITVKSGNSTSDITISQAAYVAPELPSLSGKTFVIIGNSMIYYGGMVQQGSQGSTPDPGLLSKILQAHNCQDVKVYDYTFGNHQLADFVTVCQYTDGSCVGKDHLAGLDCSKVDYLFISQAGNNKSSFYTDAAGVYNRFKKDNPNVKLYYINHIYSCYNNHQNVLGNLKNLHDKLGVTIINCGQLAYDIYKKNVTVPGGSLNYSDKYTFVNHAGSDTHHPNPLMGYIMTQMVYCALSGESAEGEDYMSLLTSCKFGNGSVSYSSYYGKYYTTSAFLPFTTVLASKEEMLGIQKLIPQYIDKY